MTETRRALVVDAEEPSRVFLAELLSGRGHACVTAGSLEEALAALEREPFDLVVMDLLLPAGHGRRPLVENGYVLEERVRARASREETRLLVRAGGDLTATEVCLAYDYGCDAFVVKSDRERLLAKLAEAVALSRRTRGAAVRRLPLKAPSWEDCTIVLGRPTCARVGAGLEVVVEPSRRVEQVLYHLQFGEEGSDLCALAAVKATRRSLARHAREFLRSVFRVGGGSSDPLPWQRTRGTWLSRVQLRERDLDQVTGTYEELRRRQADALDEGTE